jgi:DNA-binding response OmpR family regulator
MEADDYLVKPYDVGELMAWVEAADRLGPRRAGQLTSELVDREHTCVNDCWSP